MMPYFTGPNIALCVAMRKSRPQISADTAVEKGQPACRHDADFQHLGHDGQFPLALSPVRQRAEETGKEKRMKGKENRMPESPVT